MPTTKDVIFGCLPLERGWRRRPQPNIPEPIAFLTKLERASALLGLLSDSKEDHSVRRRQLRQSELVPPPTGNDGLQGRHQVLLEQPAGP